MSSSSSTSVASAADQQWPVFKCKICVLPHLGSFSADSICDTCLELSVVDQNELLLASGTKVAPVGARISDYFLNAKSKSTVS